MKKARVRHGAFVEQTNRSFSSLHCYSILQSNAYFEKGENESVRQSERQCKSKRAKNKCDFYHYHRQIMLLYALQQQTFYSQGNLINFMFYFYRGWSFFFFLG